MIIKNILNLEDSPVQKKRLIPKHQDGGEAKKMADVATVVKPAHFVEGTTPNEAKRLYRVSDTGTGALVSVPKNRAESIKGALISRIKEQYNATANKDNKERLQKLMNLVAQSKPSNLRGNEEVDMYKQMDPNLAEFIENVGFGAAAKKRGIDLSIPSKEVSTPSDTTTTSPLLTRLKQGGKIDKKEDEEDKEKPKLIMKKGGKKWIQKAVNPKHKGYCTPMSKATCTPRRKALARTFKAMAKKRKG